VIIGCGALTVFGAQQNLTLSVDGETTSVHAGSITVAEFLEEQNVEVDADDYVSYDLDYVLEGGETVVVSHAKKVVVAVDGNKIEKKLAVDSVGEALDKLGIDVGENDIVKPDANSEIEDGQVISVTRVEIKTVEKTEVIPYSTERTKDSSLAKGTEKVITDGVDGVLTEVYEITYQDGKKVSENLVSSETTEPVNQVIAEGSAEVSSRSGNTSSSGEKDSSSDLVAPNGQTCSQVITCKATAYTATGQLTASGTTAKVGVVAVDPSVIPLGTKLYVEGYGYCVAEDTGGKIKGNRIDVYLNTVSECDTWGVKNVKVYVLE
jgi:uncharacterized protein YabE (DUF348 family)